jgi:hypothetical protein
MSIVRLEALYQLKNPKTSSEIEPATFPLLAQYLNQLDTACLPFCYFTSYKIMFMFVI